MLAKNTTFLIFCFIKLLFVTIELAYSTEPILIEFLYYYDPCPTCPNQLYFHNARIIDQIERDYGNNVTVIRIPFFSAEGEEKRKLYNLSLWEQNAIIINRKIIITGYANETYIREYINYFLGTRLSPPSLQKESLKYEPLMLLIFSFTCGFFESFSPCLLIMLSFVLSYATAKSSTSQERFFQIMIFGASFTFAALLVLIMTTLGLICMTAVMHLHYLLTYILCVLILLSGIHLLGLNIFKGLGKKLKIGPLLQKLIRRFARTYLGLAILGFVFYFLDPCFAPVFTAVVALSQQKLFIGLLPIVFLIFCLGTILPFTGIGILSASLSKLVRIMHRHRSKIRVISGSILTGYSIYVIILQLFS